MPITIRKYKGLTKSQAVEALKSQSGKRRNETDEEFVMRMLPQWAQQRLKVKHVLRR